MIEFPDRGGKVISWLPAAHIAERGANYYLPMMLRALGHDLRRSAQGRRVPAAGQPDLLLRGSAHLGEAEGRPRGKSATLPDEEGEKAAQALEAAIQKVRLEQAGEEVPEELAAAVAKADEAMFPTSARRSASTRPSRSTSAPRRRRSRSSSSSTRSGSRSASCGACRRPAAPRRSTRPTRSSSARSARRFPGVEIKLAEDGEVMVKGDADHGRLPQHAGEDRRDDRRRRGSPPATSASSTRTAISRSSTARRSSSSTRPARTCRPRTSSRSSRPPAR